MTNTFLLMPFKASNHLCCLSDDLASAQRNQTTTKARFRVPLGQWRYLALHERR